MSKTAATLLLMVTQLTAAHAAPGALLAHAFLGVEPGRTTVEELDRMVEWSQHELSREDEAVRSYAMPGYHLVEAFLRDGLVRTIDVLLLGEVSPEQAAQDHGLGQPRPDAEMPIQALEGGPTSPDGRPVLYSGGAICVVISSRSGKVELLRFFSSTPGAAPITRPAPAPATASQPTEPTSTAPAVAPRKKDSPVTERIERVQSDDGTLVIRMTRVTRSSTGGSTSTVVELEEARGRIRDAEAQAETLLRDLGSLLEQFRR